MAASTGLRSAAGPARARVTDRAGWVSANVSSFQRLLGPHLDRLDPSLLSGSNAVLARLAGPLATAGRAATGAQMGVVLGWLSTRVLGQYDLLLTEEAADEQDIVYFVGPNVVALERQHGFEPREFRLWLALHEVTHRCQFTAIPWMRDYFVSLVEEGIGSLEPDPARLASALRRMTDQIRAGRNPLEDNGALGLVATAEQLEGLHRIQALMSLLEGHGDVTMDRAGAADIPSAAHFAAVLRAAPQAGPRAVPDPAAADRHRGEAPPVRGGRAVHRRRRGRGRTRAAGQRLAGPRVAPDARGDPRPVGLDLAGRCRRRPRPLTPVTGTIVDRASGHGAGAGRRPEVAALLARCTFPPAGRPLVCGVSGGPDSTALLALAVAAGCQVTAVHVDHGLRPGSADEAGVVAAAAARLGARFRAVRVEVPDGPNLEARAREARHRALGPGAATGHTMDDQAETVLGNLLRGAGVHGLAGMRAGPSHPLLALRRSETVALCARLGLATVRDPSNDDPRFVRNRVRAELLPLCADIAGRDVVPVLARQAALLAGDADLLDGVGRPCSTPPTPPPWPRRRPPRPGGPCDGGWRPTAPTRPRPTPSTGCSRWPGSSGAPLRSPAGSGSPGPPVGSPGVR